MKLKRILHEFASWLFTKTHEMTATEVMIMKEADNFNRRMLGRFWTLSTYYIARQRHTNKNLYPEFEKKWSKLIEEL